MGNANDGNWDDTKVTGKLQYALEHNLSIEIHYPGGVMLPTGGNFAVCRISTTKRLVLATNGLANLDFHSLLISILILVG